MLGFSTGGSGIGVHNSRISVWIVGYPKGENSRCSSKHTPARCPLQAWWHSNVAVPACDLYINGNTNYWISACCSVSKHIQLALWTANDSAHKGFSENSKTCATTWTNWNGSMDVSYWKQAANSAIRMLLMLKWEERGTEAGRGNRDSQKAIL